MGKGRKPAVRQDAVLDVDKLLGFDALERVSTDGETESAANRARLLSKSGTEPPPAPTGEARASRVLSKISEVMT